MFYRFVHIVQIHFIHCSILAHHFHKVPCFVMKNEPAFHLNHNIFESIIVHWKHDYFKKIYLFDSFVHFDGSLFWIIEPYNNFNLSFSDPCLKLNDIWMIHLNHNTFESFKSTMVHCGNEFHLNQFVHRKFDSFESIRSFNESWEVKELK